MIKYVIKTGSKFLNTKARNQRDLAFKSTLKGMHCRRCKSNTIIEFVEWDLTYVRSIVHSCCLEFDARIKKKLNG